MLLQTRLKGLNFQMSCSTSARANVMHRFSRLPKMFNKNREDLSQRISLQSDNKRGKYDQLFISSGKYCVAFTSPTFTKLTITQHVFMHLHCTQFYPNRTKIVENTDTFSFVPFSKSMRFTHCTDLHEICSYSIQLYRISPKSVTTR
jgi:hypothetical protein